MRRSTAVKREFEKAGVRVNRAVEDRGMVRLTIQREDIAKCPRRPIQVEEPSSFHASSAYSKTVYWIYVTA